MYPLDANLNIHTQRESRCTRTSMHFYWLFKIHGAARGTAAVIHGHWLWYFLAAHTQAQTPAPTGINSPRCPHSRTFGTVPGSGFPSNKCTLTPNPYGGLPTSSHTCWTVPFGGHSLNDHIQTRNLEPTEAHGTRPCCKPGEHISISIQRCARLAQQPLADLRHLAHNGHASHFALHDTPCSLPHLVHASSSHLA